MARFQFLGLFLSSKKTAASENIFVWIRLRTACLNNPNKGTVIAMDCRLISRWAVGFNAQQSLLPKKNNNLPAAVIRDHYTNVWLHQKTWRRHRIQTGTSRAKGVWKQYASCCCLSWTKCQRNNCRHALVLAAFVAQTKSRFRWSEVESLDQAPCDAVYWWRRLNLTSWISFLT